MATTGDQRAAAIRRLVASPSSSAWLRRKGLR